MKFFSRSWINGEMSDDQAAALPQAYWRYLDALHLPPPLVALSKVNLHDAQVLRVEHHPDHSRLTIRLRCGDLQRGYSDVSLDFAQVTVDRATLDTLSRAVRPAPVEVLYDEVDRTGECFCYRLILYPSGDVSIQFQQAEVTEERVPDREAV
jgi:hypothetical protein